MSDSITPAKDIAEYLELNDIGIYGQTLFYHNSPAGKTFQVCVRDTGGYDPGIHLSKSTKITKPTIQIKIRGNKYGYDQVFTTARQIIDLIDQSYNLEINTKRYISIHLTGDVLDLGEDTNECPVVSINFVLEQVDIS